VDYRFLLLVPILIAPSAGMPARAMPARRFPHDAHKRPPAPPTFARQMYLDRSSFAILPRSVAVRLMSLAASSAAVSTCIELKGAHDE